MFRVIDNSGESPKYYTDQQGILVVDSDWIERRADIVAYQQQYFFPADMGELLYLEVKDLCWRLEGRIIFLQEKPTKYIKDAIIIHYRTRR